MSGFDKLTALRASTEFNRMSLSKGSAERCGKTVYKVTISLPDRWQAGVQKKPALVRSALWSGPGQKIVGLETLNLQTHIIVTIMDMSIKVTTFKLPLWGGKMLKYFV